MIEIDLGGAYTERLVLHKLRDALTEKLNMRFPLTDLMLCELYFQAGLTHIDKPIATIIAGNPFVSEYYRHFPPFQLHRFQSHLGFLKEHYKREANYITRYKKADYKDFFRKIYDERYGFVLNDKMFRYLCDMFGYEFAFQEGILKQPIRVINHAYTGELMANATKWIWEQANTLPYTSDDERQADVILMSGDARQWLQPATADCFLRVALHLANTCATVDDLQQRYDTFILPSVRQLLATMQTDGYLQMIHAIRVLIGQRFPASHVHLELWAMEADFLQLLGKIDDARGHYEQAIATILAQRFPNQKKLTAFREKMILFISEDSFQAADGQLLRDIAAAPVHEQSELFQKSYAISSILQFLQAHHPHVPAWLGKRISRFKKKLMEKLRVSLLVHIAEHQSRIYRIQVFPLVKTNAELGNYSFTSQPSPTIKQPDQRSLLIGMYRFCRRHHFQVSDVLDQFQSSYLKEIDYQELFTFCLRLLAHIAQKQGVMNDEYAQLTYYVCKEFRRNLHSTPLDTLKSFYQVVSTLNGPNHKRTHVVVKALVTRCKRALERSKPNNPSMYDYVPWLAKLPNTDELELAKAHFLVGRKEEAYAILEAKYQTYHDEASKHSHFFQRLVLTMIDYYIKAQLDERLYRSLTENYDVLLAKNGFHHADMQSFLLVVSSTFETKHSRDSHAFSVGAHLPQVIRVQLARQMKDRMENGLPVDRHDFLRILKEVLELKSDDSFLLAANLLRAAEHIGLTERQNHPKLSNGHDFHDFWLFDEEMVFYQFINLSGFLEREKLWLELSALCKLTVASWENSFFHSVHDTENLEYVRQVVGILQTCTPSDKAYSSALELLQTCAEWCGHAHPHLKPVRHLLVTDSK